MTTNSKRNLVSIKDKSKEFVQLVKQIAEFEEYGLLPHAISNSLKALKLLLLKYVLQKALFIRFDTHPEFTIIEVESES